MTEIVLLFEKDEVLFKSGVAFKQIRYSNSFLIKTSSNSFWPFKDCKKSIFKVKFLCEKSAESSWKKISHFNMWTKESLFLISFSIYFEYKILYFLKICPKLCGSQEVQKATFWKTNKLQCFLWLLPAEYELGSEKFQNCGHANCEALINNTSNIDFYAFSFSGHSISQLVSSNTPSLLSSGARLLSHQFGSLGTSARLCRKRGQKLCQRGKKYIQQPRLIIWILW